MSTTPAPWDHAANCAAVPASYAEAVGFKPPTDENWAEWHKECQRKEKLRLAAVTEFITDLERHADPAVRAVMGLHRPLCAEQDECAGCSTSDYYNDAWPCETITAIADAYGVAVPEELK